MRVARSTRRGDVARRVVDDVTARARARRTRTPARARRRGVRAVMSRMRASRACAPTSAIERIASGDVSEEDATSIARETMRAPDVLLYGAIGRAYASRPNARSSVVKTLEIFAYGCVKAHALAVSAGEALELTEDETRKLRRLTTCSLCASSEGAISYERLMDELDIDDVRTLEAFIIDECLAKGIVRGRLDPKNARFWPNGAMTRDVPSSAVDDLRERVSRWLETSKAMLADLKEKSEQVASESERSSKREEEINVSIEKVKKELKSTTERDASTQVEANDSTEMEEDGQECPSTGVKRRR